MGDGRPVSEAEGDFDPERHEVREFPARCQDCLQSDNIRRMASVQACLISDVINPVYIRSVIRERLYARIIQVR
jgi:hypothetical protein